MVPIWGLVAYLLAQISRLQWLGVSSPKVRVCKQSYSAVTSNLRAYGWRVGGRDRKMEWTSSTPTKVFAGRHHILTILFAPCFSPKARLRFGGSFEIRLLVLLRSEMVLDHSLTILRESSPPGEQCDACQMYGNVTPANCSSIRPALAKDRTLLHTKGPRRCLIFST